MDQTFLMLIFGALALGGVIALSSGGGDDDDVPAVEDDTPGDTGGDTPGDTGGDTPGDTGGDTPDPAPAAPYTFVEPAPDLTRYEDLPVLDTSAEEGDIFGTENAERIDAPADGRDVNGEGGDDALFGNGESFLMGGEGDDLIVLADESGELGFSEGRGGDGADIILGGAGNDYLIAGGPNDSETFFAGLPEGPLDFDTPDTAPGDLLSGGASSDVLAFGAGDYAEGGDDLDVFVLLETELVAAADDPAFIIDYVPGERIELMDAGDAEVTFDTYEDDALILIDGQLVVVVRGAAATLDPADVTVLEGRDTFPGIDLFMPEPTPTSLSL